MSQQAKKGLVLAVLLDGGGGAREVGCDEIAAWTPAQGFLWMHLDYLGEESQRWMREESGLDELTCEALTALLLELPAEYPCRQPQPTLLELELVAVAFLLWLSY